MIGYYDLRRPLLKVMSCILNNQRREDEMWNKKGAEYSSRMENGCVEEVVHRCA